ncbi:MAG: ribbon-helix-helix protein, CopG family [Candidatus Dadabacteria bacterium]|nr:MAG: ribbon-helix-helix protein, CopG family [Candidatus Dadabacteria bacterium]
MRSVTVNISFPPELLALIDEEARQEAKSRSEFLREAVRAHIERQRRWRRIFEFGDRLREDRGLTPEDVDREVEAVRRERRGRG